MAICRENNFQLDIYTYKIFILQTLKINKAPIIFLNLPHSLGGETKIYTQSISSGYYGPTDPYVSHVTVIGEHRLMSGQHFIYCFTKQDTAGLVSKFYGLT